MPTLAFQPDIAISEQSVTKNLLKPDRYGLTPLHRAIKERRELSEIIKLIDAGSDVKQRVEVPSQQQGYTAINFAARYHPSPDLIYVLMNYGAHIEYRGDQENMTPLMLAAAHSNNPEVFTALLDLGADLYAERYSNQNAYYYAASFNTNTDMLCHVLDTYAQEGKGPPEWPDPLIYAVQRENSPVIEYLLKNGSDPNFFSTEDGFVSWTPLLIASEDKNTELCEKLILAGADPDLPTPNLYTPLSKAVRSHSDQSTIRLLLKHGADPNGVNKDGMSCLMLASMSDKHSDNLRLLVEHGANPDAIDPKGWKAIHYASKEKHRTEILDALLEFGADVDERTQKDQMTPKMNLYDRFIPRLIELGADVNAEAVGGVTPIFMAARNRPEAAQMLIDAGAEVNRTIGGGVTPLMLAAYEPLLGAAHVLLDAGADPRACDDLGRSVLDYSKNAKPFPDTKLIKRLEAAMIDG